jgi:CheY-like chemotaxis protein
MKKKMQILLADDDIDDRFFFNKALNELAISTQLTTVNDGEELMDYLNSHSDHLPNILFLDLNMPCKNGFECLSEIKHNEKLKDLQVVMLSTSYPRDMNYEREMINMLFEIGASDYIRKPENFIQLKQVIQNVLSKEGETDSHSKRALF